MRALEVILREDAISDLQELLGYIAAQGVPRSALGYIRRIRARCDAIGLAPLGGTPRDDLQQGLRTVGFERRIVIAYVIQEDQVHITNVFYGGRDLETIYRDRREED
jgi:toxin ParE1/3/4